MSDQIIILVTAVTLAFAFGMAIGISLERKRQRKRKAQKEIDWMLEPPPHPLGEYKGNPRLGTEWRVP